MSAAMIGFLGLCLVITLTPGMDTAMVLRNALRRGPRAGVLTALGCAVGLFAHAAAVALGLATVLLRSAAVFEVIRLCGAALLVVFGLLSLRAAVAGPPPLVDADGPGRFAGPAFVQGLLTNLTNPKATLFFLSALPQFVATGDQAAALPQAMLLAVIAAAFSAAGLSLVALLAGRVRGYLSHPLAQRVQEGVVGSVLVGLGVAVALDR